MRVVSRAITGTGDLGGRQMGHEEAREPALEADVFVGVGRGPPDVATHGVAKRR